MSAEKSLSLYFGPLQTSIGGPAISRGRKVTVLLSSSLRSTSLRARDLPAQGATLASVIFHAPSQGSAAPAATTPSARATAARTAVRTGLRRTGIPLISSCDLSPAYRA